MKKLSAIGSAVNLALCLALLSGCAGTVTPSHVIDTQASYDSSTPAQYDPHNSGMIRFYDDAYGNVAGAIITQNALLYYNELISTYGLQYRHEKHLTLEQNSGIKPYIDQFGNVLAKIEGEYFDAFIRMSQWSHDHKPADSTWMKLKAVVTP